MGKYFATFISNLRTMRFVFLILTSLLSRQAISQSTSISSHAIDFLASLSESQKLKTKYALNIDERYNWHYFPKSDRKGIPLQELSAEQKNKAFALLKSCLSTTGFSKTMDVIELENVLQVLENRSDNAYRNSGKYYITIFGEPGQTNAWGWRFEGHHISFNFSALDNKLTSGTPGFLGANPAVVPGGPQKGKQALKEETEAGFALLRSFTPDQLKTAVSKSGAPGEIITFVSRKASLESKEGISYGSLTTTQQAVFMKLVHAYINRYTKLFADEMIGDLTKAGLNNLRFLWAGSQQADGKPYYYRIQGPTIIIEFDNSQGNANHIHSVVRDLKNDFGGDALLEHYQKNH